MPTILEAIADRATSTSLFSDRSRRAAVDAVIDTIACMVAGQDDLAVSALRAAHVKGQGSGPSMLVGGGRAPAPQAALINATAAHALDFDDNFAPGMSHASAVLVPALVAIGQREGVSGRALVEAYLVGLEAQALVGQGVRPRHYVAGWHATSTVGTIGTAAGTAWLCGLDRAHIVQAMSLATSMAAGLKGQFGTPAKPFHAGMAARNAVEAALSAAHGLSGRTDILEGEQGFGELFGGGEPAHWTIPDGPHVIETEGLMPKLHPCCGSTHNAIDMVMDLRQEHGFAADDVESVELIVGLANYRNLAYPDPQNEMEGRFSMQYCVARALFQDVLSLGDFTPEAVHDPRIRSLYTKISMQVMPPEEERASKRPPHRARVRLRDDTMLEASRAFAKGTLPQPLTDSERRLKFVDCTEARIGKAAARDAYGMLQRLESFDDLSVFDRLLAARQPVPA